MIRDKVEYVELAGFGFSERGLTISLSRIAEPVDGNGCKIATPCFELSMNLPDQRIVSQPFDLAALESMMDEWKALIRDAYPARASTCFCWAMRHVQYGTDAGTKRLLLHELVEKVRAEGCSYFRAIEEADAIYVEGWVVQPEDQGPADVRSLLSYKQV